MSVTKQRFSSLSTLVILAAALPAFAPAALAADPPPAQPAPSDPSAAATSMAPAPSSAAPAQSAPATPATATPPATKSADKGTRKDKQGTAAKRPLNLATPDITTVVSPEELKEPMPDQVQEAQAEDDATVAVKATENAPEVLGGFGALWWAMKHPTQAWRIFTPIE